MNKNRHDLIETLEWEKLNKNIGKGTIKAYILNPYMSFESIKVGIQCLYHNIDKQLFDLICIDNYFSKEQMEEIKLGIESGHTYDDVKIYADPDYTCFDMKELRISIDTLGRKVTEELFSSYKLDFLRIYLYRTMVERKIRSVKFIKKYMMDRNFNEMQIYSYLEIFYRRFPMSITNILLHNDFDEKQLLQIIKGMNDRLTYSEIESYAVPYLDAEQMEEIRLGYCKAIDEGIDGERVRLYINRFCSPNRMRFIRERLNYDIEYLELFADTRFQKDQLEIIDRYIEDGVDKDIILDSVDWELSIYELSEKISQAMGREKFKNVLSRENIFTQAIDSKLEMNKIKFMASKNYNDCELYQVYDGFSRGLSIDDIKEYSNDDFITMERKKNEILKRKGLV